MKGKIALFGTLAAILLLAVAAYAHSNDRISDGSESYGRMGRMMSLDEMDDIHKEMTKNIDSELKEEMDEMHDGCESSFKGSTNSMMG